MNIAANMEEKAKSGYKKTKDGWIPEDWDLQKLGTLTEKVGSGITPKGGSKNYLDSGIPFIRSQNVLSGKLSIEDIAFISPEVHDSMAATKVRARDVLLNITGASIGRSCVVPDDFCEGNVNQHVCIIRTKRNLLEPTYLSNLLNSMIGVRFVYIFQAGGNREGLNFQQIKSFKIPIPPHAEQRKITQILPTWDKAIELTEKLIAAKEQQKKALMQQLLTGKKRFRGVEGEEWKAIKVGELGTIFKGKGISKSEVRNIGLPCIRYGEIYTRYNFYFKEAHSFCDQGSASQGQQIQKGDILFAGSGETVEEIGKCVAYIGNKIAYAGGDIIILRPKRQNSLFLSFVLNDDTVNKQKSVLGQGHSVVHIYPKDIAKLKIIAPCLKEQQKIASVLQTADKEIDLLRQKLAALEQQKKGLMQVLLTGKVRVKI